MKKLFLSGLVCSTIVLAGCTSQPATPQTNSSTPTETQKQGNTTKTGQVTQLAGKFYLQQPGQQPLQIDSYTVDLKNYIGKTVTITGEYSGDTLFVGQIQ